MRAPLPFFRLFALCVLIVFAPEGRAALPLPETNPYHPALARLEAIPASERSALDAWLHQTKENPGPPLNLEQHALLRALSEDLRAAATHAPTTVADWLPAGEDASAKLPERDLLAISKNLRELSKFAAKYSDTQPPAEALETYVAIAQLGRQFRTVPALFTQMVGSGLETATALEPLARRLHEFSADELARLSTAWSGLQPLPDHAATVRAERDQHFVPMVEENILSELKKLEADALAQAGLGTSAAPGFADLRLSALVDLGDGEHRISLENLNTGATFTLEQGRSVEGVLLLSVDFAARQALIRRGEREARIDLRAKQIVEARLSLAQIDAYLESNTILDAERKAFVRLALAHPGGVDGYVADLISAHDTLVASHVAAAADPIPAATAPATDSDPFAQHLVSVATNQGQNARSLRANEIRGTMLQAAIHARLRQLGREPATPAPPDPGAAEPGGDFEFSTTDDGGLVLRSRYQRSPGNATAYKFGAPDAGPAHAR